MAADFPDDADGARLRDVAASGADLSRSMTIDFAIAAPDEQSARAIAAAVDTRGFDPSIYEDPDTGRWSVFCAKSLVPSHAAVVAEQRLLTELAGEHGGRCDGWSTFGNS
jgi:hypothetical protein